MKIALIVEGDSDKIIFHSMQSWFSDKGIHVKIHPTYGFKKMKKNAVKHYFMCKKKYKVDFVIFLPDLDQILCPAIRISEFPEYDDLKFNVLVRELEAWLLADTRCIKECLSPSKRYHVSSCTDILSDPKQSLINLFIKKFQFKPTEIELANKLCKSFSFKRAMIYNKSATRFSKLIDNLITLGLHP